MKAILKKAISAFLAITMIAALFPVAARAYVGAMEENTGGITSGYQDGYYYLKNDYIGLYLRSDGNLTTVPSQKTLSDVKSIGVTEENLFYFHISEGEFRRADFSAPLSKNTMTREIVGQETSNPKLRQRITFSGGFAITITYSLVKLDRGKVEDTHIGNIIGKDGSDSGKTWGVLAEATLTGPDDDRSILWVTKHLNFGGVAHSTPGNVRLCRYTTTHFYDHVDEIYKLIDNFYTASISAGLGRTDTYGINEAYTDSFTYANQFVAMDGYARVMAGDQMISGIAGHRSEYGDMVTYSAGSRTLQVEHAMARSDSASALWGFRDLFAIADSDNIPPDPASIPQDASCVGIISNNGVLSAQAGKNEADLKARFGNRLVAVFRGAFRQENNSFIFTQGAAQLSPALTASWSTESGAFTVSADGKITARGVHLSVPTFKFYKPKTEGDTSLQFGVSEGKLTVGMNPLNNGAILHIDIPGATCSVESVSADLSGNIVFSGKLSISTPIFEASSITMTRLGMGWQGNTFKINGIEASGTVDMDDLFRMDVGSVEAEINSFPGTERYAFSLELDVHGIFEAEGNLVLKRIKSGALIPDTLYFQIATEVGVPLVPPVVVAELNGLGGGFSGLADTINGNYFAVPPIRFKVSAHGTVLEIIEGWCSVEIGPGYLSAALTDAELLKMDIIDEYKWYLELSGDSRSYQGTTYTGLSVGGGMKIVLKITNELPFIEAGGEFNASAFAGLNSYTNPTRAYLSLGCDGKVYGIVRIPKEAWSLGVDLNLLSAELAFALGGQTTVNLTGSIEDAVKDAFGNISAYGSVAYTSKILFVPIRIYYIFHEKKVGFQIGKEAEEPFNPKQQGFSRALVDPDTGEQVGVMVMSDNLSLLCSSADSGVSTFAVGQNDANGQGVTITQKDEQERSYEVDTTAFLYNPNYLYFSLKPHSGTAQNLFDSLTVQKEGEGPLALVPAVFNENNEIINESEANAVIGEDSVTLFLPGNGVWTISSSGASFDIACYYARPYASLDSMALGGATLTGNILDMDDETNYILRTYLGTVKGGTDILLSQSDVLSASVINQELQLSGTAAPTGTYYVTTVLLEEVTGDFNGDGVEDASYVATDIFEFDTTVTYTNNRQPNAPESVALEAIGSEQMRVSWNAPSAGNSPDGYLIKLYKEDNGSWVDTGAGYLLNADELSPDPDTGAYTLDMAVTVGGEDLRLEAGKTYRAGIKAFCYLEDEDGDGDADSLPVYGEEALSGAPGVYLPVATYPVLTYSPAPISGTDTIKLLCITKETEITVTSDINADIVVKRMDTSDVLSQTSSGTTLKFNTPVFEGMLNLEITAVDAEGDKTTDYIGLRFDNTAPVITLDSETITANRETGVFAATGVTESGATITGEWITNSGTSGVTFYYDEDMDDFNGEFTITADENGVFAIHGMLNAADPEYELEATDSATILLHAKDAAGNMSGFVFAQIVRGDEAPVFTGGGESTGNGVKADGEGNVSAASLKAAAAAAGRGGTVSVETTGSTLRFTGEGLKHLIDGQCSLLLNTGFGTVLIPAGVLSGLSLDVDSVIEFTLDMPDSFENPVLNSLHGSGFPVFEISLRVDGKAVHRFAGAIDVTLSSGAFVTIPGLRVIHVLDSGDYREEAYTLDGNSLSLTLSGLSHICALDGATAEELLKNPFSDINENNWYYNNVLFAYRTGLMNGTTPELFSPDLPLSRAMAVTVLYRLSGDTGSYINAFSDVPAAGSWYDKASAWAAAKGISGGVGGSLFAPLVNISREQLAAMLYRFAIIAGYDMSPGQETSLETYPDAGSISDYALPAFRWACGAGILKGDARGNLNPKGMATRAEAAAMIQRFVEYGI